MNIYTKDIDLFPIKIHLMVGEWNKEQAFAYISENIYPGYDRDCFNVNHTQEGASYDCEGHQVVWIREWVEEFAAHEFLHAIFAGLEFTGIEPGWLSCWGS